ncbi:MAG: RNA polymerase sigma factor [bacterium]
MEEVSTEVLRHCQNGSAESFAAVVETYERPIFSYVYRLLAHARVGMEPEDVVQEVFLKAYTEVRTFDPLRGAKFSTWLFAITRNTCVSLLRKKSVEREMDEVEDEDVEALADSRLPDPRAVASEREFAERVAEAVAALPEKLRSVFILRFYEELPYEEIAAVMDCNIATLKSRMSRAREKLAQVLAD